jgi:hypothetical protein
MRKLLFVVLCPVAVLALALLVGGAAGGNGNGHGNRGHGSFRSGQTGYHFLVFDAVSGTSDRMIIQGDGSFNANQAPFQRVPICGVRTGTAPGRSYRIYRIDRMAQPCGLGSTR